MTPTTTHHGASDGDAIRALDDGITADAASPDPLTPLRRMANDLLMLWAVCGKPACRRAQACKRNPRGCARRYATLAPEAARIGALLMLHALLNGIEEDAVRARGVPEIAALDAWCEHIAAMLRGAAPPGSGDPDRGR